MPSPELEGVALLRSAALEVTNAPLDHAELDTPVHALGLDSVAVIEVVAVLEERHGVRLAEDDLAEIHTVRDLLGKLAQKQTA